MYTGLQVVTYFPNGTLTYPLLKNRYSAYFSNMLESNRTCKVTDGLGFVFDNSSVYDEYSAVANVVDEYLLALIYAEVDIDTMLPEFQKELKAGIDSVIAEKQAQYDAFQIINNYCRRCYDKWNGDRNESKKQCASQNTGTAETQVQEIFTGLSYCTAWYSLFNN